MSPVTRDWVDSDCDEDDDGEGSADCLLGDSGY